MSAQKKRARSPDDAEQFRVRRARMGGNASWANLNINVSENPGHLDTIRASEYRPVSHYLLFVSEHNILNLFLTADRRASTPRRRRPGLLV